MRELKFEELTLKQKAGLVAMGGCWAAMWDKPELLEAHIRRIKNHEMGVIYMSGAREKAKLAIEKLRAAADYPLVIVTDANLTDYDHAPGAAVALGYINDEKTSYAYGKYIGIQARKYGYDIVGGPMLDRTDQNRPCGAVIRTIHPDKEISARLAAAQAQGMHDAGIMDYGKHYPSVPHDELIDSHMAEVSSSITKEDLINDSLYSYSYLMERGLLDATMPGHCKLTKVDNETTAVLSKKVIDVLRKDLGFEGLCITDSLRMFGAVAKYGYEDPCWMSIEAGNDVALSYRDDDIDYCHQAIYEAAKDGRLSMEALDKAVKRILTYMHKAYENSQKPIPELTEEEDELVRSISRRSIAAIAAPGVPASLPTDKRHLFIILTENIVTLSVNVESDSISHSWYKPEVLVKQIAKRFPNSEVFALNQYPEPDAISKAWRTAVDYDNVVFITFFDNRPFKGHEHLSWSVVSLIEAMQVTNTIKALIHFGNPFIIDDLPHVDLVLNPLKSTKAEELVIDVLAGLIPAEGKIPYKLKALERGGEKN